MSTSTEGRWTAVSRKMGSRTAMAALLPALLFAGVALAQTPPFEEAKTLSTVVDPIERSFDIPQSGTGKYRITLTDLGALLPTPAPVTAVQLVVTRGQKVVAKLDGHQDETSPTDTIDFDATPGTYTVHVVGIPGTGLGSGPVGVKIASVATTASVLDFPDTLSPVATARTDLRTYQIELDVPADGAYDMTLADLGFPHTGNIDTASVFMFQTGASSLAACLNVPATIQCPATQTVTLTAGHYELVAGGALATGKDAGVVSVYIKSVATGAVLHSRTVELGAVKRISDSSFLLDAGPYTLSLKDLAFPVALIEGSALVTRAAQVTAVADLVTPDKAFSVAADDTAYDVFTYAKADNTPAGQGTPAAPGAGTFDVEVKPASGPSALSYINAMGNPSGSPSAYLFPVDITTAGTYRLKFGDFQFPATLGASRIAIAQGGVVVGKTDPGSSSTLSLDAALSAGRATVVVIVKPALNGTTLSQTGGTFGLEMALASGGTNVLDATQGVGGLVSVRKLSITTAGHYDLTATDLDAPDAFSDLMVVVSRGSQKVGTVVVGSGGSNPQGGSATLSDLDLSAGNYAITLIAQPGATLHAATYGLSMAASPPAPTVTLTAAAGSVASGTAAGLTWSSTGATSCTASSNPSGLWSGTKAISGTDSSGNLTVLTTFTLKCTDGNGRTGEKSVTVDVAAQNSNGGGGGGGGGAFDWLTLAALALGGVIHLTARARRRTTLEGTRAPS